MKTFDKGRVEIEYENMYEITCGENRMTIWKNGDFKLIEGEKVSYWSEELCDLDQYYIC